MTNTTFTDVQKLIQEPSPQMRGQLAAKLLADFRANIFSESEATIAKEIFRLLAHDSEVKIRASLAAELAHCPHAPHDIITQLETMNSR